MRYVLLLFALMGMHSGISAQDPDSWLRFNASYTLDAWNSLGPKVHFSYEQQIKNKLNIGFEMESKRHQTFAMRDKNFELGTNQLSLLLSGSYRMNLWEDRIWFTGRAGLGAIHVYRDNTDKFGPLFRAGMSMNIRLYKRLYLETFPFFVLAFSRIDYSPLRWDDHAFFQVQILNFGLRYKLIGSTPWNQWENRENRDSMN